MATANNLAEAFGGISINKSYADIIEFKPKEEKTAEEIIESMKSKFNGEEIYELV